MLNRDFILKNFFNKMNELKRQGCKEVKMSYNEMFDLFMVINELLSDYYSKTFENIEKINNLTFSYNDGNENIILDSGSFDKDKK